jgi:agmatine deiminase
MHPSDLNFYMPPEWRTHTRTFVSWPVQASMCYPEDYERVCRGYAEIIQAIAEFEPVAVLVNPAEREILSSRFPDGQIQLLPITHNDAWLRDNGPTFIVNRQGEIAGINWRFNAWGGKYAPWDLDDLVALQLLKTLDIKQLNAPLVMEGGSFHVDGEGTLLTTEECLLNPNRNRELTKEQIEALLKKYLYVQKVIWLKRGLAGDETDGHVDNVACFAAPGRILLQACNDPNDENYAVTRENLEILHRETDARGRKIEIVQILQPPETYHQGKRLTLSYLNFYLVNGGLILPLFGGPAEKTDDLAVSILRGAFPGRKIRPVNGLAIIREGGNVHCITQQLPATVPAIK